MGKFNMKEDKEKLKALARSSKDKALAMKRKEPDSTVPKKSNNIKKSRSTHGRVGVEPITKKTLATSSGVDPSLDKGKEIVMMTDDVDRSNSPEVNLRPFFDEVAKALSESAAGRSAPDNPDMVQRFKISFTNASKALRDQFEVLNGLESIQGPLKEKLAEMVRKLAEAEADLDAANRAIKKKDVVLERSIQSKKEADDVMEALRSDLAIAQKRYEVEVEKLEDRIAGLQDDVDQLFEENEALKKGEGVDLEALIDSHQFSDIKDAIEDSVGDELIRRIKAVHPDLDLSFLTSEVTDSPSKEAENVEGYEANAEVEAEPKEVGSKEGDPKKAASDLDGGSA